MRRKGGLPINKQFMVFTGSLKVTFNHTIIKYTPSPHPAITPTGYQNLNVCRLFHSAAAEKYSFMLLWNIDQDRPHSGDATYKIESVENKHT